MKFKREWKASSIMDLCVRCGWYTHGTSAEYDRMLLFVETHKPTDLNISKVAKNIFLHSKEEGRDLNSVAWCLAREAVKVVLVEEE